MFDNANDIFTWRSNYSYVNDTVLQIDGGEERGGGHSQAQGYYLYALGEPFIDYEQVPYEDDVRMDVWKNGISFANTTQAVEGADGQYKASAGDYAYNQYYGSNDIDNYYSTEYPDFRTHSLAYGGDIEDYFGTRDGNLAGAYNYRGYFNASLVAEYFVKYGNVLVKRTVTQTSDENELYHNLININDEYTSDLTGTNYTLNRSNKYLQTKLITSNITLSLGGGETPISTCYAKTSCTENSRGYSNYSRVYYYNLTDANSDFILSHHWYLSGEQEPVVEVSNVAGDEGVQSNSEYKVIFDYNNDGVSKDGTKETDGWSLVYDVGGTEIGCFNCTYLDDGSYNISETNSSASLLVEKGSDEYILTINTMERNVYTDKAKSVQVTLDTRDLTNQSNFTVMKNGNEQVTLDSEGQDTLTFTVEPDINGDYYIITASNGTASVTCDVISSTQYSSETVDCSGEIYTVTGSSDVSFINSNLLCDDIYVETGSTIYFDSNSVIDIR